MLKQLFFGLLLGSSFIFCNNQNVEFTRQKHGEASISYSEALNVMLATKAEWKLAYLATDEKEKFLSQVGDSFNQLVYNGLLPYWYGTPWDFNGHTDSPKTGEIACGYLVSTVLKHAGFNLNRYKMAQASAKAAGEMLVGKGNLTVKTCTPFALEAFMIKNCSPGLYFLGLDFHEAFLWLTKDKLYIIHSNYINRQGVIKEEIITSQAAAASNSFWFAPIGGNNTLIKKWLLNTKLN